MTVLATIGLIVGALLVLLTLALIAAAPLVAIGILTHDHCCQAHGDGGGGWDDDFDDDGDEPVDPDDEALDEPVDDWLDLADDDPRGDRSFDMAGALARTLRYADGMLRQPTRPANP